MVSETIAVALIGLAGVIVTAFVGWAKVRTGEMRVTQAELEMRFQRAALSFPEFVEEWSEIHEEIVKLLDETCIDRFLILRAWNGHLEPRWTTAMFQMRKSGHTNISYVHFELDRDYIERLRAVTLTGTTLLDVSKLPDGSSLKMLYEAEGVTSSLVAHLVSLSGPIKGTKAVTYCSFATHDEGSIPQHTLTRCRILISRMKGLAKGFEEKPI